MDGKEHRLIDPVFYIAEARGITTGNREGILSGPWVAGGADEERGPGVLFEAFEGQLDRTSKTPDLDEASRAALEALGYVQ